MMYIFGAYLFFCLSPKFIVGKLNVALSIIPLEEFPINIEAFLSTE